MTSIDFKKLLFNMKHKNESEEDTISSKENNISSNQKFIEIVEYKDSEAQLFHKNFSQFRVGSSKNTFYIEDFIDPEEEENLLLKVIMKYGYND